MGCGCNKTGSVVPGGTMIQLLGGSRRKRSSSKKTKQRRRRRTRIIRGGNLGDQVKSLLNISSANPASQQFGKGNTYFV